MPPIKGTVTTTRGTEEREFPVVVDDPAFGIKIDLVKKTVPTDIVTKLYYTEKHKKYNEIVYNPQEGGRLFDNEEQAEKAGFVKAK